jgi:hypothetical protein
MTAAPFSDLEDATEALYYIEPKDRDPRLEEARQMAFRREAKKLCPTVRVCAVPNAGKRTQWEAAKAKREGLTAGIPDCICLWLGGGIAWIEFKAADTMPSPAQHEFLNALVRQGHNAAVFRQELTALRWLKSLGAPFLCGEL